MAANSTLVKLLTGSLSYDPHWAIYAEKINGEWSPDSPARLGQRIFENGGVYDNCEYFANNESIVYQRETYTEGDDNFAQEWAEQYIEDMNESES